MMVNVRGVAMGIPVKLSQLAIVVAAVVSACATRRTETNQSTGPEAPLDAGIDRDSETNRTPDPREGRPDAPSDSPGQAVTGDAASTPARDAGAFAHIDGASPPADAGNDAADAPAGDHRCLTELLAEALSEPLSVCVSELDTSSDFMLCASGETCTDSIEGCLRSHPLAEVRIALAPDQPEAGAEFEVRARLLGWNAVYPLTTDATLCEVHVSAPVEGVEIRGYFGVEPPRGASACVDSLGVHTGVGTNVSLLSYTMSAAPGDLVSCEAQLPRTQAALRDLIFDGVFFGFGTVANRFRCRLCEAGCEGGVACVDVGASG